jgi:hypothetical protein
MAAVGARAVASASSGSVRQAVIDAASHDPREERSGLAHDGGDDQETGRPVEREYSCSGEIDSTVRAVSVWVRG